MAFNYGHKATDAKDPQLESQAHSKGGEQGFCVLFQVTLLFDFLGFCEQAWKPFMLKITYTEAVDLLIDAVKKGKKFENHIEWGIDLASEHER
ncbi:hypothetical protein ACFX2F_037874 [Malus domestica]